MRQFPDKSDRVGEQKRLLIGEIDFAGRGVERGKEGVLDEDIGSRESAQQGGFSSIGVADDGGIRHGGPLAILALIGAVASHLHEIPLEPVDLPANFALILFELAFTLALRSDAAPLLAQMAPGTGQPGEGVRHSGQIHLDLRLACLGAGSENIENDHLAVDHGDPCQRLPVALLGWRELVVKNDHVAFEFLRPLADFFRLA